MTNKPTKKLTPAMLRRIVREEIVRTRRVRESIEGCKDPEDCKPDETDADEYADALEKPIDQVKAQKIREQRLRQRIRRISEIRRRLIKQLGR